MTEKIKHAESLTDPISMCDFCSRVTTDLVPFRCKDFTRRIIMRDRTGEMLIQSCICHIPSTGKLAHQPGDKTVSQNCIGAWGACPDCAPLVRKKDRRGLALRAYQSCLNGETPGVDEPCMPVEFYESTHDPFWLHQITGESN
jgi:hypothetical protein